MEIYTERCLLRLFRDSDIDGFMTYRNDEDWMRYQGLKGLTREEYANVLLGIRSFDGGLPLAVICKQSNVLIGDLYIQRKDSAFWLGYTICRSRARQGYAYEAVSAVINALKSEGAGCFKAGVMPENTASICLLEKLGFCYWGIDEENNRVFVLNVDSFGNDQKNT